MKLVIQIPCYGEEKTLPITLADLPRQVEGFDEVEVLVIDDGSADRTSEVAEMWGVDHLIRFKAHRGLAAAFRAGLQAALSVGADVIVNIDADHEFNGDDIVRLVDPIVREEADLVIGARPIEHIQHFSWVKKKLQRLVSWMVSQLARTYIPDATSGFRVYSREAALRLNILSDFTYVLESIVQASAKGLTITSVPVRVNEKLRESRLIRSTTEYVVRSMLTIVRLYLVYRSLRFFLTLGGIIFAGGAALGARFLWFYIGDQGEEHIPSLIVAAVLLILGFQIGLLGLVGALVAGNRKLVEEAMYRTKLLEINAARQPVHLSTDRRRGN
jgi:glycosyltransferase involved in cell wall biosynthesis